MSSMANLNVGVTVPDTDDVEAFQNLEHLLSNNSVHLIGPRGEKIEIPPQIRSLMIHFAHLLAANKAVLVTPVDTELTTQEAAVYLSISRPTLVRLLEDGEIPFTRAGKHRRVRLEDLAAYRDVKYAARKRAVEELTRMSEEMGGYDVSPDDLEAFNAA